MAHSFLFNDPEHAPQSAPWLRGVTPARVATLVALSALFAARPAFWNAELAQFDAALGRWLLQTSRWLVFSFPLFILVIKADLGTAGAEHGLRLAAFAGAVVSGAVVFALMPFAILVPPDTPGTWQWSLAFFLRAVAIGTLIATILDFARRERDAERRVHSLNLDRLEQERQATESRLHVLHAQVEPHFLFNSLASIKRLCEREPGSGRAMLRNFAGYVKSSTMRARQPEARLGDEIALAKAFLDIFGVRMGTRLRVCIDVPPRLEGARVPTLVLGTLVENAIKHGISPRASGGTVGISARLAERQLVIAVCDDGVGFRAHSGHGIGLANTRARLQAMFRGAASLDIAANPEGGVTATVSLPCRFA